MGGMPSRSKPKAEPLPPETVTLRRHLTEEEIEILIACWKVVDDRDDHDEFTIGIGRIVFTNLFNKYPHFLSYFESFKDDVDWKVNKKFIHHCKIFVNVIGSYIKLLHQPHELQHHVEYLAKKHLHFPIGKDQLIMAKDEIMVALKQSFLPEEYDARLELAWVHLIDLIIDYMVVEINKLKVESGAASH